MRTSQLLLATLKETPADAEVISHQLLLRAGMIRKLASGLYTWLPLGLRVLRKVEQIVREEMDKSGAQEVLMPMVQPADLWEKTGRWQKYGDELCRFKDRHDRDFCLGPTHEEIITDLIAHEIRSYKQLPCNFYQIQTKFRDERRPRFGIMRGREFLMKDAYSFHLNLDSLQSTYDVMYQTYCNIFDRLQLEYRAVLADNGSIGGDSSHEFHVIAQSGEDEIVYDPASDYAANVEKAVAASPSHTRGEATEALTKIETPHCTTIEALAELLKVDVSATVKTMIIKDEDGQFFACLLRGDHQLNDIKCQHLDGVQGEVTLASDDEIKQHMGATPGSLGPIHCPIPVIMDHEVAVMNNFAVGANETGYHYTGVNIDRDFSPTITADIRNVSAGDLSPVSNKPLKTARGIEVGHIFQLGTSYTEALGAQVLGEDGKAVTMQMGCYGIGVSRIVAAAIEQNHDEYGIIWPENIAPFQVAIIPMNAAKFPAVQETAQQLYDQLTAAGVEVLWDDRKERPGVMFADMDLIGIPHRIVIGTKNLDNGQVEHKTRQGDNTLVDIHQVTTLFQR